MKLAWPGLLKYNHLNEIYQKVDELGDSRRTKILTKFIKQRWSNAEWTKISVCSVAMEVSINERVAYSVNNL